jgi:hypothetical protein
MSRHWRENLWALAQTVAALVAFWAFFVFVTWLDTRPIEDAPHDIVEALPTGCPAYSVDHRTYICEWHDTIARNPLGFSLCAAILFAAFGLYVISYKSGLGLAIVEWGWWPREQPKTANTSLERTRER